MRALVAGSVSLDMLAEDQASVECSASVGSTGANIALRLASKGWDVRLVGLVGDDVPGRLVKEQLGAWGVGTTALVTRVGAVTPIVYQVRRAAGDPFLRRCPRCGCPQSRHELPLPEEMPGKSAELDDPSFLVLDCGGEIVGSLVAQAVGGSVRVWAEFSPLSNSTPLSVGTLRQSWVVKSSHEDAAQLGEGFWQSAPPVLTIETLGEHGARARLQGAGAPWRTYPARLPNGPVTDPIGAGDAFSAACIAGLSEIGVSTAPTTGELDEIMTRALGDAAAVVVVPGANGDLVPPSGAAPVVMPFACADCQLRGQVASATVGAVLTPEAWGDR